MRAIGRMQAMRILLLLSVWTAFGWGQSAEEMPKPSVLASQEVDLDFADDFPNPAKRVRARQPSTQAKSVPDPEPAPAIAPASRSWVYWTLGFSAMAGGMAWYLHWDQTRAVQPVRTDEVFTDDPG